MLQDFLLAARFYGFFCRALNPLFSQVWGNYFGDAKQLELPIHHLDVPHLSSLASDRNQRVVMMFLRLNIVLAF
jgi:hypothetical protein